jgi:Ca2+-binding EF-hand superfamily protein
MYYSSVNAPKKESSMQTFKKAIIVGTLALIPILAVAATTATTNADKAEPAKAASKRIASADTNSDGVITKQEWLAVWQNRAEKRFKAMDANGDGNVTKEELTAAHEKAKQKKAARNAKKAAKKGKK